MFDFHPINWWIYSSDVKQIHVIVHVVPKLSLIRFGTTFRLKKKYKKYCFLYFHLDLAIVMYIFTLSVFILSKSTGVCVFNCNESAHCFLM
jgi:hypothetical protein